MSRLRSVLRQVLRDPRAQKLVDNPHRRPDAGQLNGVLEALDEAQRTVGWSTTVLDTAPHTTTSLPEVEDAALATVFRACNAVSQPQRALKLYEARAPVGPPRAAVLEGGAWREGGVRLGGAWSR